MLPCGQEFGNQLPVACDHCWCARREDIHSSPLQRAYLDRLDEYLEEEPQKRQQIHRTFERLSWSYCVLVARPQQEPGAPSPHHLGSAQRYIGQRRIVGRVLCR